MQNALAVSSTNSVTQTALASQGGPGVGDLITYYYNVRVLWYSDGAKMRLAYLGSDGWVQLTAGELSAARKKLQGSSPGSVDPATHVDLDSVTELLKLDPFVDGGPSVNLPPERFAPISNGIVEVGGGAVTINASHQITKTDMNTAVTTTTDTQTDKSGFLSFLGVGVTDNNTIQSQLSQSSSAQNSSSQTFTQQYTLNGDPQGYYSGEVYFDVVFGAFAFRDVSSAGTAPLVSGILTDQRRAPLPNETVKAVTSKKTFTTATDASGKFAFRLPGASSGHLTLSSNTAQTQLNLTGQPIADVKLKRPQPRR